MSKKKTMNQPVRCIVYLSTVGDLQHVNQREQRQMNYISDYAKGILIANMQFVSKDIDDACRKIAKVSNVGGAIYSVDDGRLAFRFKEVCRGNKSR